MYYVEGFLTAESTIRSAR